MASLAFLGFFFYSFSNKEARNAQNYNLRPDADLDPDRISDFALQQFIVSTPAHLTDSALYGGHWSILSNTIGRVNADGTPTDVDPHSGRGITLRYTDTMPAPNGDGIPDNNDFFFDYDGDAAGTTNPDQDNFRLNLSRIANDGIRTFNNDPLYTMWGMDDFQPDAGYTYPDWNSLFLAYESVLPTVDGGGNSDPKRVIIPSFFRPQLFVSKRMPGPGFSDLYTDSATAGQVFRPHSSHAYEEDTNGSGMIDGNEIDIDQNGMANAVDRYLGTPTIAASGDRNRVISPFPFTAGPMGLFSGPTEPYTLDVDADGDGRLDAIWMDLNHPLVNLPDGRQAVPLMYCKIVDADGLFNLNAHGSVDNTLVTGLSHPYGASREISTSNLGLGPAEVNPLWALRGQPHNPGHLPASAQDYALAEHGAFFGFTPNVYYGGTASNYAKTITTANMELGFLLFGRTQSTSSGFPFAGRWGEPSLLLGGTLPGPGEQGTDDDRDENTSIGMPNSRPYGGFPYADNDIQGLDVPPFVHPLDYRGVGGGHLDRGGMDGAVRQLSNNILTDNPSTWPEYDQNWQDQGTTAQERHGVVPLQATLSGNLQPGAFLGLTDEGDEVILDPSFPRSDDDPYGPYETAALQLSDAHWHFTGDDSRLRRLASFNLNDSRIAPEIRRTFATESWDRLEYSSNLADVTGAAGSRRWESDTPWTSSVSNFNTTDPAFPPQFGGPNAGPGEARDPFRPEFRRLLKTERTTAGNLAGNISSNRNWPRHRLLLNRLLADDTNPGTPGYLSAFDADGNPEYRNLVPHPDFINGAPPSTMSIPPVLHDHGIGPAPFPFGAIAGDSAAQEWWARYDRQRLARDIYVLLYTVAGPDNIRANSQPYAEDLDGDGIADLVEEFAQFAVNYVDALDRDSVITRFEYDSDLSNGWDNANRVVNGVEAQQLTISEALWISATKETTDDNATFWDDSDYNHHFLTVELRNASAFEVEMLDQTWRLARRPRSMNGSQIDMAIEAAFSVRDAAVDVGPGENYIISMHDDTITVPNDAQKIRPGTFYVDTNSNNSFNAIVPYRLDDNDAMNPPGFLLPTDYQNDWPEPLAYLDLNYRDLASSGSGHENHYDFTTGSNMRFVDPTAGVDGTLVAVDDTSTEFELVLQRRRHLNTGGLITQSDQDWIDVDMLVLTAQPFTPSTAIDTLLSDERPEPFDPNPRTFGGIAPIFGRSHTIGVPQTNPLPNALTPEGTIDDPNDHRSNSQLRAVASEFRVWQPHFDRDFSSVYELLSLPIYGHRGSTDPVEWQPSDQGGPTRNLAEPGNPPEMSGHRTAQARVFQPNGDPSGDFSNRWYRLFEYIELPSRVHDEIRDQFSLQRRLPGKINLNSLRHDSVLAGLIDDPQIRLFGNPPASVGIPDFDASFPTDNVGFDTGRNWYQQFLIARDGIDPFLTGVYFESLGSSSAGVALPGVPGYSFPYRGDAHINPSAPTQSIRSTMLRPHFQSGSADILQLFEARSISDADPMSSPSNEIDYHTRHRLLSKIANNTTHRSHVFMIWHGYELFEAHNPNPQQAPDVVQIGARIEDIPGHREFVIVDMSRLEEAYVDPNPNDAVSGRFDFRNFIIYRKRIQ